MSFFLERRIKPNLPVATTESRSPSSSEEFERALRSSPEKPYEIAEPVAKEPLKPCGICGRNFSAVNLKRHIPICERIAQKPKRETFKAIAQRLAHVAQETAVQNLIQNVFEKTSMLAESPGRHKASPITPPTKEKKKSKNVVRSGNANLDLFKGTQKDLLQCCSCGRSFREEVHERHFEFCSQQQASKLQKNSPRHPKSDLLQRRIKYRPPLPKSAIGKASRAIRKAASASDASHSVPATTSQAQKSQSAIDNIRSKTFLHAELEKLTREVRQVREDAKNRRTNRESEKFPVGSPTVSCAESLVHARQPLKEAVIKTKASKVDDLAAKILKSAGDSNYVRSPASTKTKTKSASQFLPKSSGDRYRHMPDEIIKLVDHFDICEADETLDFGFTKPRDASKNSKNSKNKILQLSLEDSPTKKHSFHKHSGKFPRDEFDTRNFSQEAKNSSKNPARFSELSGFSGLVLETDSFLMPAVSRSPLPEYDRHRFFQRIGGTYKAPPMEFRSDLKLENILRSTSQERNESSTIVSSRNTSLNFHLLLDHGKNHLPITKTNGNLPLCRNCGKCFPIPEAAFCCHCGRNRR